jgi:hypothetical protein
VNRGVDVLKNAFKREQMKMQESLKSMHSALERETRPELQKLHPENKDAIATLDQKIINEIKAVRTDATLETLQVKDILAMMEKRQFVLSIPKERPPINSNNETKRKILDECHEEHEAALLNVFNKYEANGGRHNQNESDAPNPNRVQVYLHGAPRTGKTHLAKRLGETYGDVYEVPPTYATPESLFRLPGDAMADSPRALPGGSSGYGRHSYARDASPPMRARPKLYDSDYELSNEECFGKIPTKMVEEGCRVFFFDEGEKIFLGRDNDNPLVKYLFDPGRKILEGELDGINVVFPWDHQLVIVTSNTALQNDALTGRFHAYLEFRTLSAKQQEMVYDTTLDDAVRGHAKAAAIIEHCENNKYRGMILDTYRQTEHPGADTIQRAVSNVAALIIQNFGTGVNVDENRIKEEIERSFRSPALVRHDELNSNYGRSLSLSPVSSVRGRGF